jgi:hypothetical protein
MIVLTLPDGFLARFPSAEEDTRQAEALRLGTTRPFCLYPSLVRLYASNAEALLSRVDGGR